MVEKSPNQRIVAVTGLGTINSAGRNVPEYWQAIRSGQREGIITNEREWLLSRIPKNYQKKLRSSLVARVKSNDLVEDLLTLNEPAYAHLDRRYIERYLSTSAMFGFMAVSEAMRDAQAEGAVDPSRLAFVIGTGIGGGVEIADFQSTADAGDSLPSTGMPKSQPENAMIQLAIAYGAKGPSRTLTAACSSGNAAIVDAAQKIRNDKADMIVAGGVEGFHPILLALFERTAAADTGEDPSTASRVFHPNAGGAIVSEGGSVLVLEELEQAKARGAKILAIFGGAGETNDAADVTMLTGDGIEEAMYLGMEEAGITREDYLHINAHGTAAPKGDPAESNAIKKVFDGRRYDREQIKKLVYGPKGVSGHALGAANGSEAIAATMALNEGEAPPSTWLADGVLDGMEDLITDTKEAKKRPMYGVVSNGMGFGGQNTSIVLLNYEEYAKRYL